MKDKLKINTTVIFILIQILIIIKCDIIQNPIKIISDSKYPIIFNENEEYYQIITTSGIYLKNKETGTLSLIYSNEDYSPHYFICQDESSNYFLFANKAYYQIVLNSDSKITNMNQINLDINDFNYVGCFADTNQKQIVLSSPTRCDVNDNTIIIYGILNKYIHYPFLLYIRTSFRL